MTDTDMIYGDVYGRELTTGRPEAISPISTLRAWRLPSGSRSWRCTGREHVSRITTCCRGSCCDVARMAGSIGSPSTIRFRLSTPRRTRSRPTHSRWSRRLPRAAAHHVGGGLARRDHRRRGRGRRETPATR